MYQQGLIWTWLDRDVRAWGSSLAGRNDMSRHWRVPLSSLCALAFLLVMADGRPAAAARVASPLDWVVYGFSQSNVGVSDDDPQVYQLEPNVNIRAFQQWSIYGDQPSDYNFAQIARYHHSGVSLIGGGTASVTFREQFASDVEFDDMSTRDADNVPVPHDEIVPNARRGNLFNPTFRRYLLGWAK